MTDYTGKPGESGGGGVNVRSAPAQSGKMPAATGVMGSGSPGKAKATGTMGSGNAGPASCKGAMGRY